MEKVPVPVLIGGLSVIGIMSFYAWRNKKKFKRNRFQRVEIRIHNAEVGHLIGRSGEQIKDIIQKSGAKIKFVLEDDESYDYCLCIIEGDDTKVQKAQRIIYQILEQYADMDINSCFIMKGDNNNSFFFSKFNETSHIEDADHRVDSLQRDYEDDYEMYNDNLQHAFVLSLNSVTVKNTGELLRSIYSKYSLTTDYLTDHTQKLESAGADGLIPVYVSAVATPESFWVQNIKTKEHIELDRLTEELWEYYEYNPEFNIPPRHSDVKAGYICATYSAEDDRWYRAEVAEISSPNEADAKETILDLYFLDYGISSYQKIKNIRKIPQKFLALKFQAIDCGLSHVEPNSSDKSWSQLSLSFFEDMTHVGQWYVLMARIDSEDENGRPQLTLIDTNSTKDINLADEMVNKGFARYSLK